MNLNNILVAKDFEKNICSRIKDNINIENVASYYQLTNNLNLKGISQEILKYIERRFPMVSKTESFLHTDYSFVEKILSSSNLYISSELEVFSVAAAWISYNLETRRKFAKDILLKIRLPLLSYHALAQVVCKNSTFININESLLLLKNILQNREELYRDKPVSFFTNRYCEQNSFKLFICGTVDSTSMETIEQVNEIDKTKIKSVEVLARLTDQRNEFKMVYCRGDVYVVGGYDANNESKYVLSVEKYSSVYNTWKKVASLSANQQEFSACAFMDKLYVIGGVDKDNVIINSCVGLSLKDYSRKEVARLNEPRWDAACTVYGGRVVVSGGDSNDHHDLFTVEAYDHVANTWSYMPNMNKGRRSHKSVAIRNKLFVIGGFVANCEVFDSYCNSFVIMKPPKLNNFDIEITPPIVAFENKLILLDLDDRLMVCYDLDNDKWSNQCCTISPNQDSICGVKIPELL